MLKVIGSLLVLIGIVLGLYVGVWWGFIGGIIAIIEAAKAPELIPTDIAYAVARILFCQFLGGVVAFCFYIPGILMITSEK